MSSWLMRSVGSDREIPDFPLGRDTD